MADAKSALAAVYQPGRIGVEGGPTGVWIAERVERNLVSVSGWKRSFESVCDRLAEILDCRVPGRVPAGGIGRRSIDLSGQAAAPLDCRAVGR